MEIKIIRLNCGEITHVFAFIYDNMRFDIVALYCSFLNWKKVSISESALLLFLLLVAAHKHHPHFYFNFNNVDSDHTSGREVMCAGKTVGETG